MKSRIVLLLFCLLSTQMHAQRTKLHMNMSVDTTDADVRTAIHFYQNYLNEFKGKDTLPDFKKYWSKKDCERYKYPDQMIYAISGEYPTYGFKYKRTLLMVTPIKDTIQLKVQFSRVDTAKNISTFCITNHYIVFDTEKKPYFINPVDIGLRNWKTTTVRNITYYYPSYHQFNQMKADSLLQRVEQLETDWGLNPQSIKYYFAKTNEEIQHLRGFDYSMMMGNRAKPTGISDDRDNLVYCAGWDENYFHEVVHIYLNRLYPKSPLQEGLAAMYGGSMGHELAWHVKRLNTYLKEHPEIDLNDLEKFYYMDNYTNPASTIKAFLCYLAFKKEGVAGLKIIMSYEKIEDVFAQVFKLKTKDWNTFLREKLNKEDLKVKI